MSVLKKRTAGKIRRAQRVRTKTRAAGKMRVSVFRSANHMYAQLIDDTLHKTVASYSTIQFKKVSGSKKEVAHAIGKELAARALKAGVEEAIFDRGSFLYHGRVAALADGLREGGLRI